MFTPIDSSHIKPYEEVIYKINFMCNMSSEGDLF